ncbi:hypothetical protein BpHYR1_046501 [Brachionus plicatilis]|uniref:Uncharacterized protein n=1 Tax=Brachionus plicatilis TaxID=10195 RepID=A0A3M7QQW2_BRAPC|nr:hypothetical protein BpHYR1_046501 [Brachionus plicatilis]
MLNLQSSSEIKFQYNRAWCILQKFCTSLADFNKFVSDDEDAVVHFVEETGDDSDDDDDDDEIANLSESESILGSLFASNPGSEVDPCEEQDLSEEESVEKSESIMEETGLLTVKEANVCNTESESESDQELVETLGQKFQELKFDSVKEKADFFQSAALAKQLVSEETKLAVKKSFCKFSDPTPCPLCGELMKNDKGVKLHIRNLRDLIY